ncbi:hypothetical protein Hanom_Chr06g00497431 [Helianthus anomalus]
MAWEVVLWVIFFVMNVALVASNLYQVSYHCAFCISNFDYECSFLNFSYSIAESRD